MHYKILTIDSTFELYTRRTLDFTPIYHNAMQLCISEGGEEEARNPLPFAYVS